MSEVGRGTVLAGRYRTREQVRADLPGETVWRATDEILDRTVHVHVLTGQATRALDAARRAALVTDPRLVRVLDVGSHDDLSYVVTEQVDGPSLAELVASGPLGADQARALVGEVAGALEVARRRGVHHLALRPSAVHVVGDQRVVLTGLALDGVLTGHSGGDARLTSRADAIDLVRVLYAALTARWPVDERSGTPQDGLPAAPVVDGTPVPPADLVPGVPNDLDTLCAVTFGPHEDGPHTPGELVRELEPWREVRTLARWRAASGAMLTTAAGGTVGGGTGGATGAVVEGLAGAALLGATGNGGPADAPADDGALTAPFDPIADGDDETADVPAGADTAASPAPEVVPELEPITEPPVAQVRRESVRTAFVQQAGAGTNRPGTPPPAAPVRPTPLGPAPRPLPVDPATSSWDPTGPAATTPLPPSRAAAVPVAAASSFWDSPAAGDPSANAAPGAVSGAGSGRQPATDVPVAAPITRRRFDPTFFVLAVVGLIVLFGVFLAFRSLFASIDPGTSAPPAPSASASQEPSDAGTDGSPSPSDEPSSAPPVSTEPPVIASATSIDPSDGDGDEPGEKQEAVGRAFDGDLATAWYTFTYNRDDFAGFKDAVGYSMTLEATALVDEVTLHVNSEGGRVEVRATGADDPTGGPVLAEGTLGRDTVLTFDAPVETDVLTLWFTQLPPAPDGQGYRIELAEIELS